MIEITYEVSPGRKQSIAYPDRAEAEVEMNLLLNEGHYLPLSAIQILRVMEDGVILEQPMTISIHPDGRFYLEGRYES